MISPNFQFVRPQDFWGTLFNFTKNFQVFHLLLLKSNSSTTHSKRTSDADSEKIAVVSVISLEINKQACNKNIFFRSYTCITGNFKYRSKIWKVDRKLLVTEWHLVLSFLGLTIIFFFNFQSLSQFTNEWQMSINWALNGDINSEKNKFYY